MDRVFWNSMGRIPFIALMFIIFVYMNNTLVAQALDSHKINDAITIKRITNVALAYKDPVTKRYFPGVIDQRKMKQEIFESHFILEAEKQVTAKVELSTVLGTEIGTAYINKKWYDRWVPYSNFQEFNKGIYRRYVLIKGEEGFSQGILKIHIISPSEDVQ